MHTEMATVDMPKLAWLILILVTSIFSLLEKWCVTAETLSSSFCYTIKGVVSNSQKRTVSVPLYRTGTSAILDVMLSNDLWVALLADNNFNPPPYTNYEFVFGGYSNTMSLIRTAGSASSFTTFASYNAGLLNSNNYVRLWLSWEGGVLAAGTGSAVGQNKVMSYKDISPTPINYLLIGGYNAAGIIYITYCSGPRYFDQSFPVDPPFRTASMFTELDCGRACAEDPYCNGYTVARNVKPVGDVTCSIFHSISRLMLGPHHVTYLGRNATNLAL